MNTIGKRGMVAVMGLLAGTAATTAILVSTGTAGAAPASPLHHQVGTSQGVSDDPVTVTPVDGPIEPGPIREGTAVPVGEPDGGDTTEGVHVTLPANG